MAGPVVNVNDVPQAIQLALGPVFLLTGIAATLNVMTGRLARIIDRARDLTEGDAPPGLSTQDISDELRFLEARRHLASAAITACTFAALLVCMVIATLFIEVVLDAPLKGFAGAMFFFAAVSMVVGLAHFLREVQLATRSIRFQLPARRGEPPADGAQPLSPPIRPEA
jgi:Protein of unknown function (DUF2721)